jgi:hypothetical protein
MRFPGTRVALETDATDHDHVFLRPRLSARAARDGSVGIIVGLVYVMVGVSGVDSWGETTCEMDEMRWTAHNVYVRATNDYTNRRLANQEKPIDNKLTPMPSAEQRRQGRRRHLQAYIHIHAAEMHCNHSYLAS